VPEIWLPYGQVEVVINAKAEILGEVLEAPAQGMAEESLQDALKKLPRKEFVVLDGSNMALDMLNRLTALWGAAPKEISVHGGGRWAPSARKRLARYGYAVSEEGPTVELGVVDGVLVRSLSNMRKEDSLIISEASLDPVYGIRGSAAVLAEALGLGAEAVRRWKGEPAPATETDPGWFAGRLAEELGDPFCLEYVRSRHGLAAINVGPHAEVHSKSAQLLKDTRVIPAAKSRLLVVSPGGGEADSTLHASLLALCNQAEAVGDDAEVMLVAEAGEGLGSPALRSLCDLGVRPESLMHVDGYEDIVMLKWLKANMKLHVISTLPLTLVEKRLGLLASASAKNAFEDIESRHGWKLKATMVKDGALTSVRPAQ
jgi:hypothetical protein